MTLGVAVIGLMLAAVAGVVSFVLLGRRSSKPPDGVAQFQRHIGALSPDARREVIDRVRASQHQTSD